VIADRIPVGWGRAVFVSFAVIILISVVEVFTVPFNSEHLGLAVALIDASVLVLSVPLVLAVSSELAYVNRIRDNASFGIARAHRWRSGIAIFVPAVAVTGVITLAISDALGLTSTTAIESEHTSVGYKLLIGILVVWVAPWTEEVAMRGFLFSALWRRWGFWPAAFLSGFVWSALHGTAGVLLTFTCVGMLAAWLRRYTGSIMPGVFLHGSWNALSAALTGAGWLVLPPMALFYASMYGVRRWLPRSEPA
jgi:membrane protease YdiL (CAAX protease family)